MPTDFTLPELGENIQSGDVLRVLVKPGDTIAKDQSVVELETDKATIEVPSSVEGKVTAVAVKPGDKVKVGQAILTVESADGAEPAQAPAKQAPAKEHEAAEEAGPEQSAAAVGANTAEKVPADGGQEQHAEGRKAPAHAQNDKPGVRPQAAASAAEEAEPRDERQVEKEDAEAAEDETTDEAAPARGKEAAVASGRARAAASPDRDKVVAISRGARAAAEPAASPEPAPAAPSVRRMARELGVDINEVPGTGSSGRISVDDVKAYAKRLLTAAAKAQPAAEPLPDFSRWGEIDRQPMRTIRRRTAERLAAAWATVPHVTQHELADITSLEDLRKKYIKQAEAAGGSLTLTAIAVKVVGAALKAFPQVNASIDLAASEIIYKKYVHVGIAVDTDRGLLVPVLRNVDAKSIIQLSVELTDLSTKARAGKLSLDEMQGGCFTISNLGGIGGTAFSPIVNAPEVAILGISRARMEPVWRRPEGDDEEGRFVPRLMLPLSLSYDHRAIDGADAIRFVRWIADALEQPFLIALQG